MTYKAGTFLVGLDDLMVFVSDNTVLHFENLSKACVKSLALSKKTFMSVTSEGFHMNRADESLVDQTPNI